MKQSNFTETDSFDPTQNLTSLWAFSEGFLGGIFSAAKIPFKGLLLGNISVSVIILIANFNSKKGAILKAGTITTIIKAIISPYSTLPAYIAVFTQTLLGELLFLKRKYMRMCGIVLGIVTSVISSLQRIIVLTLIFGNSFWETVDSFAAYIYNEFSGGHVIPSGFRFSNWLIGTYVFIHAVIGFVTGYYVSGYAQRIRHNEIFGKEFLSDFSKDNSFLKEGDLIKTKKLKSKYLKFSKIALFIFLLTVLILSYVLNDTQNKSFFDSKSVWLMILRSLTIMILWLKLIGPFFNSLIKSRLLKNRNKYSEEIHYTLKMLPSIKQLLLYSWKSSGGKGFRKIPFFVSVFLPALLGYKAED